MLLIENKVSKQIIQKNSIATTVISTALFALVFINVYAPFGVDFWLNVSDYELFFYSSLVILAGMVVIAVSRILMYWYSKRKPINYIIYISWVGLEILSMSIVYTIMVKFILKDPREVLEIFKPTLKNTALVLLIPYIVLWLYFSWKDKKEKLESIQHSDALSTHQGSRMIPFKDEKGTLRFSAKLEDLLYIEAADNYITVHYLSSEKLTRFMVRNSLKTYEEILKPMKFIRCHRSFIVNFEKVKIIRKEKDGLYLEMDSETIVTLPVSKTYVPAVLEEFSKMG